MRGAEAQRLPSRVKGKAAIVKTLHSLHRRVFRLATKRSCSPEDYRWPKGLSTELTGGFRTPKPSGAPSKMADDAISDRGPETRRFSRNKGFG